MCEVSLSLKVDRKVGDVAGTADSSVFFQTFAYVPRILLSRQLRHIWVHRLAPAAAGARREMGVAGG